MIYDDILDYDHVEGWCAGCKVSGITETSLHHKAFPSLETIMKMAVKETEGSCIMVSCNDKEEAVIAWLKKNRFSRGPIVKNWGHGGRKTRVYFKQIPKRLWVKQTGMDDGW